MTPGNPQVPRNALGRTRAVRRGVRPARLAHLRRSPAGIPAGIRAGIVVSVLAAGLTGCGARSSEAPEAGYQRGGIPDLRGERVLVLPPQFVRGGHADLERELLYALEGRGPTVTWVGPDAIRRRAANTPSLGFDPDALPVERFLHAEVERVGDPLFGALYRLAALEGANWALLPIEVRERVPVAEGGDGTGAGGGATAPPPPTAGNVRPDTTRVEIVAALIHPRSGRVTWYGIVDGSPGPPGALSSTASVVEALARRLLSF